MLAAVILATGPPAMPGRALPAHASASAPLPAGRLEFGLANQPADLGWMTASGVPWKYRYQYLSGGVNSGGGWETWNSPPGAFAAFYMKDSGANGYLPVFTYYEICQSLPAKCPQDERAGDLGNLGNTATMSSYYANFRLLMQQVHTFGKPVVVQVEPDLWGYLEQAAAGGDASTVSASVSSSGFPDAAGIPNTAQGFAWALLHIRDVYAPNASLAIHASAWAAGADIASSTDPSLNFVAIADATAAFLNSAGVTGNPYGSTWDAVFNDVDDHDAGWWEAQNRDNQYFTHWWDPTNTTFPNFSRYLAWVSELHVQTGRQQVAWQVPVGNQYFLTENNTCGHYQDNVAQYFLGHTQSLFNAGLVAVLFGAGNGCQSNNTDAVGDGVTNNNGQPTVDLQGHCNGCNVNVSGQADDDGGFLRFLVGKYYALNVRDPASQSAPGVPGGRPANPIPSASPRPRAALVQPGGHAPTAGSSTAVTAARVDLPSIPLGGHAIEFRRLYSRGDPGAGTHSVEVPLPGSGDRKSSQGRRGGFLGGSVL